MGRSAIPGPVRDEANLHPNPKAVLQETLVEARSRGISAIEWSRAETGQHPLIMMVAEVTVSEGFIDYARRAKEASWQPFDCQLSSCTLSTWKHLDARVSAVILSTLRP